MTYFVSFFAHGKGIESRHGNLCLDASFPIEGDYDIKLLELEILRLAKASRPEIDEVTIISFQKLG